MTGPKRAECAYAKVRCNVCRASVNWSWPMWPQALALADELDLCGLLNRLCTCLLLRCYDAERMHYVHPRCSRAKVAAPDRKLAKHPEFGIPNSRDRAVQTRSTQGWCAVARCLAHKPWPFTLRDPFAPQAAQITEAVAAWRPPPCQQDLGVRPHACTSPAQPPSRPDAGCVASIAAGPLQRSALPRLSCRL